MLTFLLIWFCLAIAMLAVIAALSARSNRGRTHIPCEEDDHPELHQPVWLVEVICRWQDRNAVNLFGAVFFFVALQILRACSPL